MITCNANSVNDNKADNPGREIQHESFMTLISWAFKQRDMRADFTNTCWLSALTWSITAVKLVYPCIAGTGIFRENCINIMAAEALAPRVVRLSATTVLSFLGHVNNEIWLKMKNKNKKQTNKKTRRANLLSDTTLSSRYFKEYVPRALIQLGYFVFNYTTLLPNIIN